MWARLNFRGCVERRYKKMYIRKTTQRNRKTTFENSISTASTGIFHPAETSNFKADIFHLAINSKEILKEIMLPMWARLNFRGCVERRYKKMYIRKTTQRNRKTTFENSISTASTGIFHPAETSNLNADIFHLATTHFFF